MKLNQLLQGLEQKEIIGDGDIEIGSIVYDSRKVQKDSLFICIDGYVSDGHDYIPQAIKAGAAAVMIQKDRMVAGPVCIRVPDTRIGLAMASCNYFGNPSRKLHLVGITGTKGKTTATFMIRSILEADGKKSGLIGTIVNLIGDEKVHTSRTTPESYDLQSLLADCVRSGLGHCIMEVSSQGLFLNRVYGCEYEIGVFTNLYNDHIGAGEHANIDEYWQAKALLFDRSKNAVINIDADYSIQMMERVKANKNASLITFGLSPNAMVRAMDLETIVSKDRIGTRFTIESPWYHGSLFVGMPGKFNVYNALCAISCAGILGVPFEAILAGLSDVTVKGRVQAVRTNRDFQVIVDYAHNAASLESLLQTLREYRKGRLICVFGCGGNRAKSRRFDMGEISGKFADFTVITSDNPRTEPPESILMDIETGVKRTKGEYVKILDRTDAISYAITHAQPGDMVIIAGKGHEDYQEFADRTIHYDDVEVATKILEEM